MLGHNDLRDENVSRKYRCSECGAFTVLLTCSDKCRKRRQRRKQQARQAFSVAMRELGKVRDSIKRREDVDKHIADLQRLKGEINDLLVLAGDKDAMARLQMLEDRRGKK